MSKLCPTIKNAALHPVVLTPRQRREQPVSESAITRRTLCADVAVSNMNSWRCAEIDELSSQHWKHSSNWRIRPGRRSLHIQKHTCSSCGYPAAKIRQCKLRYWDDWEVWEGFDSGRGLIRNRQLGREGQEKKDYRYWTYATHERRSKTIQERLPNWRTKGCPWTFYHFCMRDEYGELIAWEMAADWLLMVSSRLRSKLQMPSIAWNWG